MTTTATTATPPQTDPNDADAQLAEQQRLCFEQQSSCSDSTFWSATRLCLECVAGNDCGYAALHCRDSCEAPN